MLKILIAFIYASFGFALFYSVKTALFAYTSSATGEYQWATHSVEIILGVSVFVMFTTLLANIVTHEKPSCASLI